ncbi:MAG: helix-turn-helix domain-containing protein [Nannocystaceae bacterium]
MSRSSSAKRRLGVDERRAELLELGLELFAKVAYDALSIDAIARAAGISKGLLYHYFPSKRDYYVATVRVAAERLLVATATATADDDLAPTELLLRGLDAYLDFVERHGEAYATLLRSGIGSDPEVVEIVERTRGAFARQIRERLGLADAPLARLALRGWVGFVEVTSLDWRAGREIDRPQLRRLLARALLGTLAAAELRSAAVAALVADADEAALSHS